MALSKITTGFAVLASFTAGLFTPSFATESLGLDDEITEQYIVQFHKQPPNTKEKIHSSLTAQGQILTGKTGGKMLRVLPSVDAVTMQLTSAQLAKLQKHGGVKRIEPDPLRYFQGETRSYGVKAIKAHKLNDKNTANTKVCIIDTGVDMDHEDLPLSNISGESLNNQFDWQQDKSGHGTHITGVIAALGGNNTGVVGVNPGGHIKIHMVKVADDTLWNNVRSSDLIAAVESCVTWGADIINMSIAGDENNQTEADAMKAAFDKGVLLFAAAGNGGGTSFQYPASYDSVISVGATDARNKPWTKSQKNAQVELVAPGVKIRSTLPENQYANLDSTSVASAFGAGAAALVWSLHEDCTHEQIRNMLVLTAKDLMGRGRDSETGYGLIQADKASKQIEKRGCDNSNTGNDNQAPSISGTPATQVIVGGLYQFKPVASDPDRNDTLTFDIQNQPSWTSFNRATGELSGIPGEGDTGIFRDIVITVFDSFGTSATLAPFNIEVSAAIRDFRCQAGQMVVGFSNGVPVCEEMPVATFELKQESCSWRDWGSKGEVGPAICPVGQYVVGHEGTGISTGGKRNFGRILCCAIK